MVPFEKTEGIEGIEGEQTSETDLTRCHQVFEEGGNFESSVLRLTRCFLGLLSGHTLIVGFLE